MNIQQTARTIKVIVLIIAATILLSGIVSSYTIYQLSFTELTLSVIRQALLFTIFYVAYWLYPATSNKDAFIKSTFIISAAIVSSLVSLAVVYFTLNLNYSHLSGAIANLIAVYLALHFFSPRHNANLPLSNSSLN